MCWMHGHVHGFFGHGLHWYCCGPGWMHWTSSEDRLEWLKRVRKHLEQELRWIDEEIARGEKKE